MKEYTYFKLAPYIAVFWHCNYCGMNNHEQYTAYEFQNTEEVTCRNCNEISIVKY